MYRFLLISLLVLTPLVSYAQDLAPNGASCGNIYQNGDAGLFNNVSCVCVAKGDCDAGDFMVVVFNASQLLFGVAGAAALLMFIAGGFMLIISSGNQSYVDRGKQILRAAVIGLAIIFGAWLIINGIVVALTGNPSGTIFGSEWYTFEQ